jgi:elongation factor P
LGNFDTKFQEQKNMYSASDLRKGLKIQIDGEPYIVVDFQFSKPGKGQALYRTRLKNMVTGNQFDRTFRSNDKFEKAPLEERTMQYLYSQGDEFHFMDTKNYEQIVISREQMGDGVNFLIDNMEVQILLFNNNPIGVTLPNFVTLTVTKADPWAKGDTSGSDSKPVTVETGYVLQVPPFIEEGDRIQIDTRTGAYMTRVKG